MERVLPTIPTPTPLVDLFIPVRNGERFIDACIKSILDQTFSHWRLSIVDNCSIDGTRGIAGKYLADPRVRYVCNDEDLGSIGNFNHCLDMIETDYYALLSHDDFFRRPDALEQAVEALRDHPEVGVVYSDVEWVDGEGRRIADKRMPFRGRVVGPELSRRCLIECRNHFGVPVLLRTRDVRGLRYDPAFPLTCDIDFSIGCINRTLAYFLPISAVAIRFHESNGTMRSFKGAGTEFLALANKHQIRMGPVVMLWFTFNNVLNILKKWAFFFYLDHLRHRNSA